jgi:hypothetical protein
MSNEEDLIDYSDEELGTNDAAPAANGGAKKKPIRRAVMLVFTRPVSAISY